MHIAITTLWFPHDKNPLYGIFILNQAKALAEFVDVTVMISRRKLLPYTTSYKIGNVHVIERGGPFLPNTNEKRLTNWSKYYIEMFEQTNKRQKIDLIHCHDYIALYPTLQLNKKYNIPYVVTIHNTDFLRGRVAAWRNEYIREAFRQSKKVISVGESLSETLAQYSKKAHITTIPNTVDTELFSYKYPPAHVPFRFLFVGIYEDRKRVMEILKAFHHLNKSTTQLTFVGYGSLEKQMHKYVKDHDLTSRVVILPPMKNEELTPVYQSHHCYISYSTSETFGITVAEAMSCGLHIIYSKSGGPEHFVSPNGSLMVEGNSVEILSSKMEEMIQNYDPELSSNIREHVVEHLSEESVVKRILSLHNDAINEKNHNS